MNEQEKLRNKRGKMEVGTKREKEEEMKFRHIGRVVIIASSHPRLFEVQMA